MPTLDVEHTYSMTASAAAVTWRLMVYPKKTGRPQGRPCAGEISLQVIIELIPAAPEQLDFGF